MTRVILERGRTWVFAAALDWPGWCRRGKGEEAALDALAQYAPRYAAAIADLAQPGVHEARFDVVETVRGTATTDFGAPDARCSLDAEPADAAETARLVAVLGACWASFEAVAAAAPKELRKGPRGGGRDTAAIVDHVREAERSYCRKIGAKVPPRTPWPQQRIAIAQALEPALRGEVETAWPARYLVRRTAWHVLDHAWEIEDRAT